MKTLITVMILLATANAAPQLYEIRWDGTLCTLSGGGDRRILRKNPVQESCHFPIPAQQSCVLAAFSNAKTLRYDGDKIILTPLFFKEPALGDLQCESAR